MIAVAVGSVRSGGATALALALAGVLESAVLVEADPDGGVLALRYGLGREPGLASLAASRQDAGDLVLDHTQRLPGGLGVVVAPESPERASQILRSAGHRLASLLTFTAGHVVVDVGRIRPSSAAAPLAESAAAVLVVARPRAEELIAAAERVATLGAGAGLVLVGQGPYSAREVTDQLGCPVLGTVTHDPRAAQALADGGSPRALARSALVRSVRSLADTLFPHRPGAAPSVGANVASGSTREGVWA